jgi:hypothetical protein
MVATHGHFCYGTMLFLCQAVSEKIRQGIMLIQERFGPNSVVRAGHQFSIACANIVHCLWVISFSFFCRNEWL